MAEEKRKYRRRGPTKGQREAEEAAAKAQAALDRERKKSKGLRDKLADFGAGVKARAVPFGAGLGARMLIDGVRDTLADKLPEKLRPQLDSIATGLVGEVVPRFIKSDVLKGQVRSALMGASGYMVDVEAAKAALMPGDPAGAVPPPGAGQQPIMWTPPTVPIPRFAPTVRPIAYQPIRQPVGPPVVTVPNRRR